MNPRILFAEDDPSLGYVIQDNLQRKGYDITLCTDGESAEQAAAATDFDLCILDVMLPKKDGFAVAQAIRKYNSQIPILFVTAKGMLEDRLTGFGAGGDDYIVKPFSIEELCVRMEVFLRRTNPPIVRRDPVFDLGSYNFDFANLTLKGQAEKRTLTQKEAEVLKILCIHRNKVVKREEILNIVWGDDDYFMGRSLDVFISKLRKYLKNDPAVQIVNFHGVGFKLEA